MTRKVVSVAIDELVHEEARKLAKQQKKSFSRLVEELVAKYVKDERAREERARLLERESRDKGEKLSREFMKRLLFDENYRSEEWTQVC
jgi:hypothetical protein